MKKNILKSLFVGMLCMLAASCQDTEELAQAVDSSKAQVVFSIAMDSPIARSRANQSWGNYDPTDDGTPKDNHIDINQFVVKMEIQGQEYHLSDIIKWKAEHEENVYQFVGVVNGIIEKTDINGAKISVFANMGSDEENLKDEFPYSAVNIPMWGVRTIKLEQNDENRYLAPGTRVDLGNIALLRAMAKMEVALTPEMAADYDLKEVTLNEFNGTGNCFPTDYTSFENTQDMSTTGVFNPLDKDPQALLTFKNETKDGTTNTSFIVYLPEVDNKDNSLEVTVKLLPKNASDETALEIGTFAVMDYTNEASPVAIDIIRNHWYKYEVSGFDANNIKVNYQTLAWAEENIYVGGEGFLFLNKDVIEIYNANVDADQLKFSSSTPIKSIVLKDIYKHENDGTFTEGTLDGVSAYYVTKFGQKVQLGVDPGFEFEGKPEALAKEMEIVNAISAVPVYDETGLNGGITINSPYIGHETYGDSHYDTPRYLEFEVTNEQDLTATFRVMQYPPVVITNEEGYFSYRSDQKFSEDQEEASHFHNYMGWKSFHLTGLMWGYEFDWTNVPDKEDEDYFVGNSAKDYSTVINNPDAVPAKAFCEVLHYGNLGAPHSFIDNRGVTYSSKYGGIYKSTTYPTDAFFRHRYYKYPGGQSTGIYIKGGYRFNSKNYDYPRGDIQGLAVGPYYERDGRTYRKQFVWNIQPIFYNLYVSKVYDKDENGKLKGQADLNSMTYSVTMEPGIMDGEWVSWGKQAYTNHRMYVVRTNTSSPNYNVGYPLLTADGVTENTKSNAKIVSPKFAVASQLGETRYQSIITLAEENNYKVPVVGEFYKLAVEHCREYVETTFIDKNGNHVWNEDETVIHYDDWRLPTSAEINLIIEYQKNSRAMDRLLVGQYYFCAAGADEKADVNNYKYWVSDEVTGYNTDMTGYYIRCVRDVKP